MATGIQFSKAPKFKARRDRHVSVITVDCPTCKVLAGTACFRLDGGIPSGHLQHPARRRMAVRADNLARGI